MKIGIGSYALFWESSDRNPAPLDLPGAIDRAAHLGCEVFQICDDPRIEQLDAAHLQDLRERAELLGIELELGTRTITPDHLGRHLDLAHALGARTLRSMIQTHEIAGGPGAAVAALRTTLPRLESAGVTLALETYEQIPTPVLLGIVEEVDSPHIGICLDPANPVSALEHPKDVVEACAARTANLHVKDFAFARQEGWVGFTFSGAPLGEGLLDLDHELSAVYSRPQGASATSSSDADPSAADPSTAHPSAPHRAPSAIVEHWLPWQGDLAATLAAERDWTDRTLAALRTWRAAHAS